MIRNRLRAVKRYGQTTGFKSDLSHVGIRECGVPNFRG